MAPCVADTREAHHNTRELHHSQMLTVCKALAGTFLADAHKKMPARREVAGKPKIGPRDDIRWVCGARGAPHLSAITHIGCVYCR